VIKEVAVGQTSETSADKNKCATPVNAVKCLRIQWRLEITPAASKHGDPGVYIARSVDYLKVKNIR
jgi:hypothetical protein